MYQFFQQCFQQYLSVYSEEIADNEHLLTLIAPLYGLANPGNYETWKLSSDLRYYEASHLTYCMISDPSLPAELKGLGESLQEHGYDPIRASGTFSEETVRDQLKLIYTMITKNSATRPDLFPPKESPGYPAGDCA